jgi:hypothetical protein
MAVKTIPALPNVPAQTPAYLRPFLEKLRNAGAVRYGLTTNRLDRSPTVRELMETGLIKMDRSGRLSGDKGGIEDLISPPPLPPAYTGPPEIAEAVFTISLAGVLISWPPLTGWNQLYVSHMEVWRSGPIATDDFEAYPALAIYEVADGTVKIDWVNPAIEDEPPVVYLAGISSTTMYADPLPPASHFIYWLRYVDEFNNKGPWYQLSGTKITSSVDASAYLEVLEGQINEAHLNSMLRDDIERAAIMTVDFELIKTQFDAIQLDFTDNELLQHIRNLGDIARLDATEVFTTAKVLTERTEREGAVSALATIIDAMEVTLYDPDEGMLARASALESFRTYVENQSGSGFLAQSSYLAGISATVDEHSGLWSSQASINTQVNTNTGEISVLGTAVQGLEVSMYHPTTGVEARATALEEFKAYVGNMNEDGYLAEASFTAGLKVTVDQHEGYWITQASINTQVNNNTGAISTLGEKTEFIEASLYGEGELLRVTVGGVTYTVGDGHLTHDPITHQWKLALPPSHVMSAGSHLVLAQIVSPTNVVTSDNTSFELLIDPTLPSRPTVINQQTRNLTPTIHGRVVLGDGHSFKVRVNLIDYVLGQTPALTYNPIDCTWRLQIPASNALTAGTSYNVIATVGMNNDTVTTIDETNNELIISSNLPGVPTVITQLTNRTTPTVHGRAEVLDGEALVVTLNSKEYRVGDGRLFFNAYLNTWRLVVPAEHVLAAGTYTVVASVVGSSTTSNSVGTNNLVINTTAPSRPTVETQRTHRTSPILFGRAVFTETRLNAKALAVENLRAYVYDDGAGGLIANSGYLRGIQATVGEHSVYWDEQAQVNVELDGRTTGRYFNRIDNNGRITGLEYFDGFGDLQEVSNFIIRADVFQFRTTTTDKVPFAINGDTASLDFEVISLNGFIPNANIGEITADKITVTGLAGVSTIAEVIIGEGHIDNLMIGNEIRSTTFDPTAGVGWRMQKDGAIEAAQFTLRDSDGAIILTAGGTMDGAYITNLSVDTLKIAGNAVTVPYFSEGTGGTVVTNVWTTVLSIAVDWGAVTPQAALVVGAANFVPGGSGTNSLAIRFRQSSSGGTLGNMATSVASGFATQLTSSAVFTPISATETYELQVFKDSSSTYSISLKNIMILGAKR